MTRALSGAALGSLVEQQTVGAQVLFAGAGDQVAPQALSARAQTVRQGVAGFEHRDARTVLGRQEARRCLHRRAHGRGIAVVALALHARFFAGDLLDADWGDPTVVLAYLSPELMETLAPRFRNTLAPGTRELPSPTVERNSLRSNPFDNVHAESDGFSSFGNDALRDSAI